jgi:TusE/DsrC/DsvC family sulfur relay protein
MKQRGLQPDKRRLIMSQQKYADLKIKVDDEGFLENPDDWNEKVACALAEKEGVEELTKDRMEIIKFLRGHYRKYNFFPILRSVCKNVHQPRECVREQFMDPLTAWKVAGLPKPNAQVIGYLRGEGGVV